MLRPADAARTSPEAIDAAMGALATALLRASVRGEPLPGALEALLGGLRAAIPGLLEAAIVRFDPESGAVRSVCCTSPQTPLAEALAAGCSGSIERRDTPGRPLLGPCQDCGNRGTPACQLFGAAVLPLHERERTLGLLVGRPYAAAQRAALLGRLSTLSDALGSVLAREEAESAKLHAEQRYLHAQRLEAVGQLAGGVVHDFNNLLATIRLTTRLLGPELEGRAEALRDLSEIDHACEQGSRLTRQLLLFARREAMTPEVIRPAPLLRALERLFCRLLGEDVALRLELEGEEAAVRIDPGALEQIVMNLVMNARDAMPRGGTLTVRLAPAGAAAPDERRWLALSVQDSGVGMDEATQARIFEPFFTTKGKERGTGLGLAVVQSAVRVAHGLVRVTSAPGEGARFEVLLPRLPDEEAQAATQGGVRAIAAPLARRRARLLVVEDEPTLGRFLQRFLVRSGHEVRLVRGHAEASALTSAELHATDALLSDVVLPDGDGVELAAALSARRPGLPVMLLSGYLDDRSQHEEIQRRGFSFLGKPFLPDELLARVEQLLP